MAKKLVPFILAFLCTAAQAYTVGQHLTIENKTDKLLAVSIDRPKNLGSETPNSQAPVLEFVAPKTSVKIYTENGDNSGWLSQLSSASFQIRDGQTDLPYVNGVIVFYVGAGADRWSFLDSISASLGLTIQTTYSCFSAADLPFENKIVIAGDPQGPALAPLYLPNQRPICKGLSASDLDKDKNTYKATCSDGKRQAVFERAYPEATAACNTRLICDVGSGCASIVTDSCLWKVQGSSFDFFALRPDAERNGIDLKTLFDQDIGDQYCGTDKF